MKHSVAQQNRLNACTVKEFLHFEKFEFKIHMFNLFMI